MDLVERQLEINRLLSQYYQDRLSKHGIQQALENIYKGVDLIGKKLSDTDYFIVLEVTFEEELFCQYLTNEENIGHSLHDLLIVASVVKPKSIFTPKDSPSPGYCMVYIPIRMTNDDDSQYLPKAFSTQFIAPPMVSLVSEPISPMSKLESSKDAKSNESLSVGTMTKKEEHERTLDQLLNEQDQSFDEVE